MSSNPQKTATERAFKYGIPYLHRDGKTVYLVTKLDELTRRGHIAVKELKSAGLARKFVAEAIQANDGWKTRG